jgi:tetratricopeptide (TPR) repeat protein
MRFFLGLLLIVLVAALPGRGRTADDSGTLAEARKLFAQGAYTEAAAHAAKVGGAEGLALAAEMTSHYAHFIAPADARLELYRNAISWTEEALLLDDKNAYVHLEAAHALGRYAQEIGVMDALGQGLASSVRRQIDAALALEPDNANAHLLLANWHAEIIASSGFMGRVLYGTSEDEARAHLERALALAPNNILIQLEAAGALLKLDATENRAAARAHLEAALALKPADAFEGVVHEAAQHQLDGLAN